MNTRMKSAHILGLGILCFMALVLTTAHLTHGVLNDDTYITLRYAKNICWHHEFSYNLGHPTYSLTTPLWALLLAVGGIFSTDFVAMAPIVSSLLMACSALLLYLLRRRDSPDQPASACAVLFLLDVYVVGAAYNGTEMGLFSLLSVLLFSLVRRRPSRWREFFWMALVLALLVLTRPEGLVILAVTLIYLGLFANQERRLVAATAVLALTLLLLLPWFVFAWRTFGLLLPTSIILKSVDRMGRLPFSDPVTMAGLASLIARGYGPHLVIVGLGAGALLRRAGQRASGGRRPWDAFRGREEDLLPLMYVLSLLFLYFGFLKEKYLSSRYLVVISPYLMMIVAQGLGEVGKQLRSNHRRIILTGLVLSIGALNILAIRSRVERSRLEDGPRVAAGKWVAENLPPSSVLANFGGAGAIAYYFDGLAWDYDLISAPGPDLQLARRRRTGQRVSIEEYLQKNPSAIVTSLSDGRWDAAGPVIYENSVYKVVLTGKQERREESDR